MLFKEGQESQEGVPRRPEAFQEYVKKSPRKTTFLNQFRKTPPVCRHKCEHEVPKPSLLGFFAGIMFSGSSFTTLFK